MAVNLYALTSSALKAERRVNPDTYLAANAELLFTAITVSFCVTYAARPEVLMKNGIRDLAGYNNPCVFWDSPPALYVATLLFTPTVYFAIRYAVLDTQRAFMNPRLSHRLRTAILVVNVWYAISQMVNMLIFVVTPHETVDLNKIRLHSAFFLQLVPALGMAMAMNYFEGWAAGHKVEVWQWAVLALGMTFTVLETVMAGIAVFGWAGYKDGDINAPSEPVISPTLMQVVDFGWFLSLPLVSTFDPPSPMIRIDMELDELPPDEEAAAINE